MTASLLPAPRAASAPSLASQPPSCAPTPSRGPAAATHGLGAAAAPLGPGTDAAAAPLDPGPDQRLRLAAAVFEQSAHAIVITDRDNRIVSVNRAFTQITGYAAAEALGRNPRLLASGRHDRAFYEAMWRALAEQGCWQGEIWNRRKSGECYPEWLRISVLRDADGAVTHHVASFSDLTENKAAEARIHRLAFYDALTGLPNRVLARERAVAALAEADRTGRRVAVLFLDLDDFKSINDRLGHAAGDALLAQAGERLRALVRATDTVARLGGDEFALLLPGLSRTGDADPIAQSLVARMAQPMVLEAQSLRVTTSVGVALYPDDGADWDALLRAADAAMYQAKRSGRSRWRRYSSTLHAAASARWQLEHELRAALERGELCLHYQPQVELASGRVVAHEALVRWQHPQRGLLAPAEFIGLAEDTGLVVPLGAWVLDEACRQAARWARAGAAGARVAVNVSAVQFASAGFVDRVAAALERAQLAPASLELELTERVLMEDTDAAIGRLQRLRALGVGLALDDFGTGYSSLAYLQRLPIDCLKIDRAFVAGLEQRSSDQAIVRMVIGLARTLGLRVVAEGVETAGQARRLHEDGCEQAQGWLFGRPGPALAS